MTNTNYVYPKGDFISGFGAKSDYELACQKMVIAGATYLDQTPDSKPSFDQYKNIYGITTNENEDMKALQKVMLDAVKDCSGAMMQACTNHVLYIHKNGWNKYIKEITNVNPSHPFKSPSLFQKRG